MCGEGDIKERSSASISSFCYSAGDVHVYSSRQLTLQCVNGFTCVGEISSLQAGVKKFFFPSLFLIIIPVASACYLGLCWSQREFLKSSDDWGERIFPLMDEP